MEDNHKSREVLLKELNQCRLDLERTNLVISVANDGIYDWDVKSNNIYFDTRYYTMAGYKENEFPGTFDEWAKRVHPDDYARVDKNVQAYLSGELENYNEEFRFKCKNGEWMWIQARVKIVTRTKNGESLRIIGTHQDITIRKQSEEKLKRIAHYDILTNLPNRSLITNILSKAMLQCSHHGQSLAVVLLDLDGFKHVNDTHGHSAGDKVICEIAQRLNNVLYPKDVIARINGAEFCILVELSDPKYGATAVARKMLSCFDDVYQFDQQQITVTASIGITRFPEDAEKPQELLRKAGLAMFDIKALRINNYKFFEQQMNNVAAEQLAQEQKLLTAIKSDSFDFYYQPFVDTKSGIISGAEALIRWIEPDGNIIYPVIL